MRRLSTLGTILSLMTMSRVVVAQQMTPAGVVPAAIVSVSAVPAAIAPAGVVPAGIGPAPFVESSHGSLAPTDGPRAVVVDSAQGHPWRWVGIGALAGGATAGIAAAVSASRNDDAFFAGPAIGVATAAGAIVGGLVGGFLYLISR